MPSSDASSNSSSCADVPEIEDGLSKLLLAKRDLETTISAAMITGSISERPQQSAKRCPFDSTVCGTTRSQQLGRKSISRGFPYEQNGISKGLHHIRFHANESSQTAKKMSGCPILGFLAESYPCSEVLNSLPDGDEVDVDVVANNRVLLTRGEETISTATSKDVYHLRRAPSGEFFSRSDVDDIHIYEIDSSQSTRGASACNELFLERSKEYEQDEYGAGPLRRVRSKENIRLYRSKSQERQHEMSNMNDDEVLKKIREVRNKIKSVQDKLQA